MGILRNSKVRNSRPRPEDSPVPRFIISQRKTLDVPVYDKSGQLVRTVRRKVVEHKVIDQKEFLNEGVDCSMFSVENLEKAGINPQVVTAPLLKVTLEDRSSVTDLIEGYDYETLVGNTNDNKEIIDNE